MVSIEKAQQYHKKYPFIWVAFENECIKAVKKGSSHESAKWFFEIMRRSYKELATSEKFKLNNDYSAFYARMWAEKHPGNANLFEFRDSKYDKQNNNQLTLF